MSDIAIRRKIKMRNIPLVIFLVILILPGDVTAQIKNFNLGVGVGAGSVSGNSTPQSSFDLKIFADFKTFFSNEVSFRATYIYARKVEYFLPSTNTGGYYPFMHSFGLQAFMEQNIFGSIYIEGGAGIIAVNDRTFSDSNVWDFGTGFCVYCGFDFRDEAKKGFSIGAALDYGITFTHTNANYNLISLQSRYYF